MAGRDPAAKRLTRAIAHSKRRRNWAQGLAAFVGAPVSDNRDWTNRTVRAAHASAALTLRDVPSDEPLRKAFEAFGLDPADPWNWRLLLYHVVRTHGRLASRRPGPEPKRDWRLLLMHARQIDPSAQLSNTDPRGTLSDAELAKALQKKFPDVYKGKKQATVQKYLRLARGNFEREVVAQQSERRR
jgi:hypothetical protein